MEKIVEAKSTDSYWVWQEGIYEKRTREEIRGIRSHIEMWSARLSTGIFGKPNCKVGNLGPKGESEVLLATGDEGLRKLIDLGFITCPVCRPEETQNFWERIREIVAAKYNLHSLEDFADRQKLPFDARRVNYEEVIGIIGRAPNRLYIPRDVVTSELWDLRKRFESLGVLLPHVGYFNPDIPEMFTEYKVPSKE